jgi:YidC/Oxa1 family membrane protein insertase
VVDYGWLTVIAAPLFWVLGSDLQTGRQLGLGHHRPHHAAQGYFFPLSAASYKSMAKMRVIGPKLQKLKEIHGDDQARNSTRR